MWRDVTRENTHATACAAPTPPPLHIVFADSIFFSASSKLCGIPLSAELLDAPVNVGVRDGNQKSGSLALAARACSTSICFSAAASASAASVATCEDEKEMDVVDEEGGFLRFSPVSTETQVSDRLKAM